jgi:hypothetical protein
MANKPAPPAPSSVRVTLPTRLLPEKKSTVKVKMSKAFGSSSNPTIKAGRERFIVSVFSYCEKSTGGVADSASGGDDHVDQDSGTCLFSSGVSNEMV